MFFVNFLSAQYPGDLQLTWNCLEMCVPQSVQGSVALVKRFG
jgi:hypothetical protein